jgi:hypothetical protein
MENKAQLPEEIDPFDLLILEKLQLKEENLQLKEENLQLKGAMIQQALKEAQLELAEHRAKVASKYKMSENDQIDTSSLKIIRK